MARRVRDFVQNGLSRMYGSISVEPMHRFCMNDFLPSKSMQEHHLQSNILFLTKEEHGSRHILGSSHVENSGENRVCREDGGMESDSYDNFFNP